jgi:formate hydrogenlyase subunit 3/multisubunit Na+/H+ antiporter MnhD subunit
LSFRGDYIKPDSLLFSLYISNLETFLNPPLLFTLKTKKMKQNLLLLALILFTIGMMYSMITRNINLMIACESLTLVSIALLLYLLKRKQ